MLWFSTFYGSPYWKKGCYTIFIMLSAPQHSVTKAMSPADIKVHSDCWIKCLLLQMMHTVGARFNKFASSGSSPGHGRHTS